MCGRFTLHSRLNLLLQQFALEAGPEWAPRYNIAPTQFAPIIRSSPASGKREMVLLRWGLVPSWSKDVSTGSRMINARAETVATKPAFRTAFKHRRCVIPANGFFEWQKTANGKQPYYVHLPDETPLAMAGLWDVWHSGKDDALETFAVITTQANEAMQQIHDRMPVILPEDDFPLWLDGEFDGREALESMLRPYEGDDLQLDPISTRINNPRNDDPQCIELQRELF
jgi:putative SOS response-associated peptidase YedK